MTQIVQGDVHASDHTGHARDKDGGGINRANTSAGSRNADDAWIGKFKSGVQAEFKRDSSEVIGAVLEAQSRIDDLTVRSGSLEGKGPGNGRGVERKITKDLRFGATDRRDTIGRQERCNQAGSRPGPDVLQGECYRDGFVRIDAAIGRLLLRKKMRSGGDNERSGS